MLEDTRHVAGDADRHQVAGKMGPRNQTGIGHEAHGAFIDARYSDVGQRLAHPLGPLAAPEAQFVQPAGQRRVRGIETEADDMDWNALPFDGDFHAIHEIHANFLSRRPCDGEATHVVMVGQRPQIDAIGRRPPGHLVWRQKAVRNDRMAVKIEIGWSHGLALLNKR